MAKQLMAKMATPRAILSLIGPIRLRYMHTRAVSCRLQIFTRQYSVQPVALLDKHGVHAYKGIFQKSHSFADELATVYRSLGEPKSARRVAVLCPNDVSFTVALLGAWLNDSVAVPLCKMHPEAELKYFLKDSQSTVIVSSQEYNEKCQSIAKDMNIPHVRLDEGKFLPSVNGGEGTLVVTDRSSYLIREAIDQGAEHGRNAMLIYTSGTTGRPKGVVVSFRNLHAIINGMITSWGWSPNDTILHVLPLHHIHGVVNVLLTAAYCGAKCVMVPRFDAKEVWSLLLYPVKGLGGQRVNLFMAVPTIYAKLIQDMNEDVDFVRATCQRHIRLMVSGSAALPVPVMDRWRELTGHTLLERYGMSEIGMCLSNPLNGPRIPGSVGHPLPQVEVRIGQPSPEGDGRYIVIAEADQHKTAVKHGFENEQGELLVRGPSVFREYWNRLEATEEAFTEDGWFKTGDTASYRGSSFKILGRSSVDIIKSGGYKISALEVERHLLSHPDILNCAVMGLDDDIWGQRVVAMVTISDGATLTFSELRDWCKDRMPPYQIPSAAKFVKDIPCNAMGKVNKKELVKLFQLNNDND